MYRLDGKSVLLMGGATGIGRRIATRLAEEGCDVGIVDINMEAAEHTRVMVERAGRRCAVFKADVGDFDQASAAVDAFLTTFGKIDVLANNAGVISIGLIEETSVEEWHRICRINLDGVFDFCKASVPYMRERKSGKIVNTARGSARPASRTTAPIARRSLPLSVLLKPWRSSWRPSGST